MGENEYGISGHLHNFALLKHLMVLLRYNFFTDSFLHLIKDTDNIENIVKTLLNDAFKYICKL